LLGVGVAERKLLSRRRDASSVRDASDADTLHQAFTSRHDAKTVLDRAASYLDGIGFVAPPLRGRMERFGDALAIHHGRIETRITTRPAAIGAGTRVEIHRHGRPPLADTRRSLLAMGLGGFLLAWLLTFYNERQGGVLHPLVMITLYLLGLVATVAVLYVADRSLERRSATLVLAVEDAVEGDPTLVLRREMDGLDWSGSLANGFLFYCAGLVASFIAYAIVFSPDVVRDIDRAVAVATMRFAFLFPILPALLFTAIYYRMVNRRHHERIDLFARQ
jgi:hypothetical protein